MRSIRTAAEKLALPWPELQAPVANYQPTVKLGNLLIMAGQVGGVGDSFSLSAASAAAQHCALQLLAQLAHLVQDDANSIQRILRLGVFIRAPADFAEHSQVADAASNVFTQVLGQSGLHTRTAIGVTSLPAHALVEVDAMVAIQDA